MLNASVGTLNELLLSLNLSLSNTFPTHYREKEDQYPDFVHDKLRTEVGEFEYKKIYDHAYEMAYEIKANFMSDGFMANTYDIAEIAWTASPAPDRDDRPSEHHKFTGVSDPNSDADIMIKTISGNFLGISAKYGSIKTTTLRTPGASTIAKLLNIDNISLPVEKHNAYMETLGFTGSLRERKEQYKKIRGSSLAKTAAQSMIKARTEICSGIHSKLKLKNSDELRNLTLSFIAPETVFPHYRTHTIVKNGSAVHKVYNIRNETDRTLSNYSVLYLHSLHNDTAYVTIYGKNDITDTEEPVIKYSAKNKSSPMMGWDGHITAPMLSKRKR